MAKNLTQKLDTAEIGESLRQFEREAELLAEGFEDIRCGRYIADDAARDWLDGLCRGEKMPIPGTPKAPSAR